MALPASHDFWTIEEESLPTAVEDGLQAALLEKPRRILVDLWKSPLPTFVKPALRLAAESHRSEVRQVRILVVV